MIHILIVSSLKRFDLFRKLRIPFPKLFHQQLKSLIQVVIGQHSIKVPISHSIIQLRLRIRKPLNHRLLLLRPPSPQPLLQHLHRRRCNKYVNGIERTFLDVSYALYVNVENAYLSLILNAFDGGDGGAVVVAVYVGVFDEFAFVDFFFDGFDCGEVVVYSVLFPLSWITRGVTNTETKLGRIFLAQKFNQSTLSNSTWPSKYNWLWLSGSVRHYFIRCLSEVAEVGVTRDCE
mmetsp:Transcript_38347/g.80391  ORF Transcript_38347/g.80391 Transcript_38347/m.80391 type:complete len:233 (+) Transcript_38347:215-913(+)